jgi:putative hydrolase of the HAD superfamily
MTECDHGDPIMSSSIRVVFFDAADTLFHVQGSVAEIYLRHAIEFGFPQKPDSLVSIKHAFSRAFREAPPPVFAVTDPTRIKQSERLWWFDIVHHVFYRVGMFERFDEFFDHVFRVFEDHRSWRLFPETASTLTQLKGRNLELGIISNFDSRLFTVLRGLGIAEAFDTVTISSLAQAAKPAPQIFHLALEKHAVDPEEALHIGDSLREDVEGAKKAGLHTVLLDRDGKQQGVGIRTIKNLEELFQLLERFEE